MTSRWFALGLALLCAFAPVAALRAAPPHRTNKSAPPDRPPTLSFKSATLDFGEVWSGPAVEPVFEFRNEGEGVLHILEVKPACGCTAAGTYDRAIYPGAAGRIPFTVATRGRIGTMSKTVSIRTNDPKYAALTLTIQGRVKTWLTFDPPQGVTIGSVRPGESFERSMTVDYALEDAIELKLEPSPTSAPPPFKLNWTPDGGDAHKARRWRLTLSGQAPQQQGSQSFTYLLKPSRPELTPQDLVITLYVRPPVQAVPSLLTLKLDPRGVADGTLMLQSQDKDFRVLSALATDKQLTVGAPQQVDPRTWSVAVEAPREFTPNDARLIIRTDLPEQRELSVQVMIVRQAASRTNRTVPRRAPAAAKAPAAGRTAASAPGAESK